jgi:hypothetical protein
MSSALSSIGGESLAGSGFESESIQRGFASASVNATDEATASGASSPLLSDVSSVGSAGPASSQPPATTAREKGALSRVAGQFQGFRRRLRSLPSDAAPHATPPRIPIEHEE